MRQNSTGPFHGPLEGEDPPQDTQLERVESSPCALDKSPIAILTYPQIGSPWRKQPPPYDLHKTTPGNATCVILEENEAIAHEAASTILGQASGRLFGKHPTLISGKPPPFLHFSFLPPPPSPFYCILGLDTAPRPKFWPRKKGVQSLKFQTEVHARFIGLRSSGGLAGTISPTPQPQASLFLLWPCKSPET